MKGYILTYTSSNPRDIVNINNALFGRVVTTSNKKYFYTGNLDTINYIKICEGCYFIHVDDISSINIPNTTIVRANVEYSTSLLKSARQVKREKYVDVMVKNL